MYLLIRSAEAGPNGLSLDLLHLSSKLLGFDCDVGQLDNSKEQDLGVRMAFDRTEALYKAAGAADKFKRE